MLHVGPGVVELSAGKARAAASFLEGVAYLSGVQETVTAEHADSSLRHDVGGTAVGAVNTVGVGVANFLVVTVNDAVTAESARAQAVVGGDIGGITSGAIFGARRVLGRSRIANFTTIDEAVSAASADSVAADVDLVLSLVEAGRAVSLASGQGRIASLTVIDDSVTALGTATITNGDPAVVASGTVGGTNVVLEGNIANLSSVDKSVTALVTGSFFISDREPLLLGSGTGSATAAVIETVFIGSGIAKFASSDVQNAVSAEGTASLSFGISVVAVELFLVQNHAFLAASHTVVSAVGVLGVVANFTLKVIDNSVTAESTAERSHGDGALRTSTVEEASRVRGVALLSFV